MEEIADAVGGWRGVAEAGDVEGALTWAGVEECGGGGHPDAAGHCMAGFRGQAHSPSIFIIANHRFSKRRDPHTVNT